MALAHVHPAQVQPAAEEDESVVAGAWVETPVEVQRQLFFGLDRHLGIPVAVILLLPIVLPTDALGQADDAFRFRFAENSVWHVLLLCSILPQVGAVGTSSLERIYYLNSFKLS